jgi:hypothetical protein
MIAAVARRDFRVPRPYRRMTPTSAVFAAVERAADDRVRHSTIARRLRCFVVRGEEGSRCSGEGVEFADLHGAEDAASTPDADVLAVEVRHAC